MSRSQHREAQIIAALKQIEAGRTVGDVTTRLAVCRVAAIPVGRLWSHVQGFSRDGITASVFRIPSS